MPTALTQQQFIDRSTVIHNGKYDYSKVVYLGSMKPITIICPIHGEFVQPAYRHLNDKRGCIKCGKHTPSLEEYITQCNKVHSNKYLYNLVAELPNLQNKITILCSVHGKFLQRANDHKKGSGCPRCANPVRNTAHFIEAANTVHAIKYDYSKTVYETSHKKVTITCPIHGDFKQTPNGHLSGGGCIPCGKITTMTSGGYYCSRFFKLYPDKENVPAIFYVIWGSNKDENFVKIGITTNTVQKRYRAHKYVSNYQIQSLLEVKMTLKQAFDLEQQFKRKYNNISYTPTQQFNGWTECFIPNDEMLLDILNVVQSSSGTGISS